MSVLKKVVKCDICKRYDCDVDGRLNIKIREGTWDDRWMTKMDICPDCSHEMREWIRMKRMKKDSKSASANSRVVGVTRIAVLNELHAQVASGNLKEEVAGDILANLFEEDSNE